MSKTPRRLTKLRSAQSKLASGIEELGKIKLATLDNGSLLTRLSGILSILDDTQALIDDALEMGQPHEESINP